jgi:hypothetical protein
MKTILESYGKLIMVTVTGGYIYWVLETKFPYTPIMGPTHEEEKVSLKMLYRLVRREVKITVDEIHGNR